MTNPSSGQPKQSRKRKAQSSAAPATGTATPKPCPFPDYVYDPATGYFTNPATGKSLSRVQAQPQREWYNEQLAIKAEQEAKKRKQEQDAEMAKRPQAAPGNRGDGRLHLAFIPVGQGDCAILSTPKGRVVLFDCGSVAGGGTDDEEEGKAKESAADFADRVRSVIDGPKFMGTLEPDGTAPRINILITTHPDQDHYNKLEAVLKHGYKIDNWYFSAEHIAYSVGGTSAFLWRLLPDPKVNAQKKVVLNRDPKNLPSNPGAITINGKDVPEPQPGEATPVTEPKPDGEGGIRILDEPDCKISILAADVRYDYEADGSTDINRGSVVTLIEAFGKKILMCGDATKSTEKFLMNTTKSRLADLYLVQAGHHGSDTSSSADFIKQVNPFKVVVSAGKKIRKYHLPYEDVIRDYRAQLKASSRPEVGEHTTWYWKGGAWNWEHIGDKSPYEVYTTGSWDRVIEVDLPAPAAPPSASTTPSAP